MAIDVEVWLHQVWDLPRWAPEKLEPTFNGEKLVPAKEVGQWARFTGYLTNEDTSSSQVIAWFRDCEFHRAILILEDQGEPQPIPGTNDLELPPSFNYVVTGSLYMHFPMYEPDPNVDPNAEPFIISPSEQDPAREV